VIREFNRRKQLEKAAGQRMDRIAAAGTKQ
jgi:hypothetical protein